MQTTSTEVLKSYVFNEPIVIENAHMPVGPASIFMVIICRIKWWFTCCMRLVVGQAWFYWLVDVVLLYLQHGSKRMPGTAITKSVVANEPGGRKRDEIFVDVIEKISVTFNSSVSISCHLLCVFFFLFNCCKSLKLCDMYCIV